MIRRRKVLLGLGATLLAVALCVILLPRLLWADPVDYSRVSSIEHTAEYQDPKLLERAWSLPVAARYRGGLESQKNPSFCGPTSVVNVLHSLGHPASQHSVLEGTNVATFFGLIPGGLGLDQLAELLELKEGKKVSVFRDLDLNSLRAHLRASNDPANRYVVNFSRGPLFGRGGGHHSPIGGYLERENLVLVVDVNKAYGPWLVSPERLLEAINTVDRSTGKRRGLILLGE